MYYNHKTPRTGRYDYTSPGCYFVTLCTHDREHYFGEIIEHTMVLEPRGHICDEELHVMLSKRPSVDIHEYIIMPNHVHLLMVIDDRRDTGLPCPENIHQPCPVNNTQKNKDNRRDMGLPCPANDNSYRENNKDDASVRPYKPSIITNQSLGSIIGGWKSATSKRCHEQGLSFVRQPRYHDHIVRDEGEYERIKYYIQTNAENREDDTFH